MGVSDGERRAVGLPATSTKHDYQLCRDEDCERFPCRVYKEGFRAGRDAGYSEGYGDGYGEGYGQGFDDGFSAGAASASR